MKRTVLLSSTILAIITVLELSQASRALPTPATVKPTVNESVETPFNSNQSTWRRCRDRNGGNYPCPRFVMPPTSEE
ncbi:Osc7112_2153 family protein [Microcoleus sp. A2-C5]|uniref:Osc7112_2153 family protein n=1 Tax=Microcoleaceae TaxID=1892252 RepID=UPI002237B9B2|nr:Osc7112_2153 family protein [Lyngbya sp. CCAP 1446/10]